MTTVEVIELEEDEIQDWYSKGYIDYVPGEDEFLPENTGVVIKTGARTKEHGIYRDNKVIALKYPEALGVKPKSSEQHLAMAMLMDDDIPLKIITGKEGVGKNFITAACVLDLLMDGNNKYNNVVLTRTTDEVGKSLGYLPGSLDDKFGAHLTSFKYTFGAIGGDEALRYWDEKIRYVPIQYMRGVSYPPGTIVWADEIAGLSPFELRMLCTRLGHDCILILTGSLEQIDRKLKPEQTGLYKLINSKKIQRSKLVSHIELRKNERSPISKLIGDVL